MKKNKQLWKHVLIVGFTGLLVACNQMRNEGAQEQKQASVTSSEEISAKREIAQTTGKMGVITIHGFGNFFQHR